MANKTFRSIDVDETGDVACTTKCTMTGLMFFNDTDSQVYAHVYDKATAAVVGTDTPKRTYPLPARTGITREWTTDDGPEFLLGISVGASTTLSGSSGPATNGVICDVDYDT